MSLQVGNVLGVLEGNYVVLLFYFGLCGLGVVIVKYYSMLVCDFCCLFCEVQYFVWLGLDMEEGQEYWFSMNLVGDYVCVCYEWIYLNLLKVLGLKFLVNVNNYYNFVWKEEIVFGQIVIVYCKGVIFVQKG